MRGDLTWHYRVFEHDDGQLELVEVIHENGRLIGWTEADPAADTVEELREMVEQWLPPAFDKPILNRAAFGMAHCCSGHEEGAAELRSDLAALFASDKAK